MYKQEINNNIFILVYFNKLCKKVKNSLWLGIYEDLFDVHETIVASSNGNKQVKEIIMNYIKRSLIIYTFQ